MDNRRDLSTAIICFLPGRYEEEQLRDPFVRVFLLPDEHTYHTSRMQRRTLNPVFNEVFTFHVSVKWRHCLIQFTLLATPCHKKPTTLTGKTEQS